MIASRRLISSFIGWIGGGETQFAVEPVEGRLDFRARHNQVGVFGLRSAWGVAPLFQIPFLSQILHDRSAIECL